MENKDVLDRLHGLDVVADRKIVVDRPTSLRPNRDEDMLSDWTAPCAGKAARSRLGRIAPPAPGLPADA